VDVLGLLVVFLDGAQGAVEEPGLPQLVARTAASVVRGFFSLLAPEPVDRAHGEKTRTAKAVVRATRFPFVSAEAWVPLVDRFVQTVRDLITQ
jgi:hypothetical protein